MAEKRYDTVYGKIPDNEPIFILRGQDCLASMVVEQWAELAAKLKVKPEKILEAYRCADAMRQWKTRRLPD